MTSIGRRGKQQNAGQTIELRLDGPASDGASVGRDASGRAVFCAGGLPGESVRVELNTEKKRFARGHVIEVLEPHAQRVVPSCATHAAGCGGCDLAHASAGLQTDMKRQIVADALVRIGRVDETLVRTLLSASIGRVEAVGASGYRTTARAAITDGRAGYRKRSSHDVIHPSTCAVVHPLLEELLLGGRYKTGAGDEVVLRVSQATGERIALVAGDPEMAELPEDVIVVGRHQVAAGRSVHLTEEAAGRSWRVSADSFFQAGPTVASALVAAVRSAAGPVDGSTLVDAYAGIGLFGGTVGATARDLISIEQSGSSTEDARVNLAEMSATIVEGAVEEWKARPADIVIADPARRGLGDGGVAALERCGAPRFVLVSCDTGSLGRDVGLLSSHGYEVDSVQVINAFPDTSHVETVVGLRR